MKQQKAILTPKGMQKDTSVTVFSSEYAFDIKNMRFTATDENSFMCLTNEKSNAKYKVYTKVYIQGTRFEDVEVTDLGTIIGVQALSDYCIIFRVTSRYDIISKLTLEEDTLYIKDLYAGDLGFSKEHPIESIGIIESETIHKVYWTDNYNIPRVINTSEEGISKIIHSDTQFDFITTVPDTGLEVSIEKSFSGGLFPGGVIQYAISYFNKYGQQTNLIYYSPLQYTSNLDRGVSPEDTVNNIFSLYINNYSTDFSHMRIYRIMRTSLDAVPSVERLPDVQIDNTNNPIVVIDNGMSGITVDPTELLYIGGREFTANTLTHKDNTLFLGNLSSKANTISYQDKVLIKDITRDKNQFILEEVTNIIEDTEDNLNIQYYYSNNLKRPSNEITFFQKGETYRFGLQFLTDKGNWSDIIHLGDIKNDKRVVPSKFIDEVQKRPMFETSVDITTIKEKYPNFIAARLLCVYPTDLNREVLCQGIALPTLYNLYDRLDNSPFAQASWFARPDYMLDDYDDYTSAKAPFEGDYSKMALKRMTLKGFPLEYRMFTHNNVNLLPGAHAYNSEVQYSKILESTADGTSSGLLVQKDSTLNKRFKYIEDTTADNNFGVDRTIVTMHSPELDTHFTEYMYASSMKNIKFRVIGHIPYKGTYSDISVKTSSVFDPNYSRLLSGKIINKYLKDTTLTGDSFNSFPMWVDSLSLSSDSEGPIYKPDPDDDDKPKTPIVAFAVYPWHRAGSMNNQGPRTDHSKRKAVLEEKIISNFRITLPPRFLDKNFELVNISDIEYFNSNEMVLTQLKTGWNSNSIINYYGNIDRALTVSGAKEGDTKYPIYAGYNKLVSEGYNDYIDDITFLTGDATTTVGNYTAITNLYPNDSPFYPDEGVDGTGETYSRDVLPIQYKSSSHAVFSLEQLGDKYYLLPEFKYSKIDSKCNIVMKLVKDEIGGGSVTLKNKLDKIVTIEGDMTPVISSSRNHQGFFIGNITEGKNTGGATLQIAVNSQEGDDLSIESIQFYLYNSPVILGENQIQGTMVYPTMYINGSLFMKCLESNLTEGETLDNEYGFTKVYKPEDNTNIVSLRLGNPHEDNSGMSYWQHIFTKIIVTIKKTEGYVVTYYPIEYLFKGIPDVITEYDFNLENKTLLSNYNPTKYYSYTKDSLQKLGDNNVIWEEPGKSDDFIQYAIPVLKETIDVNTENPEDKPLLYNSSYVLGELYREVPNKFGGDSEEALSLNNWTPCSDVIYLNDVTDNTLNIRTNQGDTYFQRYDNLKTYPFADGCVNNIVDITSFCCETRINIDGRYDRQRNLQSHLHIKPTNFNLFNKVYSQKNNFFNQPYIDSDEFTTTSFPNQVTWSKTKTLGEEIDTWTNINLANILDLDGDKGDLQKLLKFNNNIYAIQDRGVSAINFNPRVQINTSDGVPIEISNGGKVDGKIYLSEKYGTTNKWSVVETPSGFYFVDGTNQEILACNGKEFSSLTMTNKMYSWLKDKDTSSVWSPVNTKAIRALYDSKNKDIYFTNDSEALSFSELSSTFTSRYSYDNVGWLFNFNNDTYQVYSKYINNSIWKLHGGDDYGYFFDEDKQNPVEYSIEYVVNDNFPYDKMFDTVELLTNDIFPADRTGNMYPFDTLQTQNEYQESISYSSSMKKKFRIWRWPIGRNSKNSIPSRDRIRNTWIKLKLAGNRHDKIQLYNTSVIYYV